MRQLTLLLIGIWSLNLTIQAQPVQDDFEGNGTITTWAPDGLGIDNSLPNPFVDNDNPSATVMEYHDTGGQYANVRFDVPLNFNLSTHHTFSLKIYVPASGLTGTAPNQVSLKLQNGDLAQPWTSQSEVIKPISLDQWQTVTFDFANDPYVNFDPNSPPPIQRPDFNRVLIQVNGENNTDQVLAYIDDVLYDGTLGEDTSGNSGSMYDVLVWSDEFDGTGAIDTSKWWQQTQLPNGDSWWGTEIQHYTDRIDNSYVENGSLHILAKKETYTDQGVTKQHTSARLNSKFAFTYGRIEVRAKMPTGAGTFPAIWMLGQNIDEPGGYWTNQGYGQFLWPNCGEMDIIEHWGDNQNYVASATHTPAGFGATASVGGRIVPNVSTEFHLYSLDWSPQRLVFAVDGTVNLIYQPSVQDGNTWPFDLPHYLLLNVAMLPTVERTFTESAMEIDYVRVYQDSAAATTNLVFSPKQPINIYPNPVQNALHLSLPNAAGQSLVFEVTDLSGRLQQTYHRTLTEPEVTLDETTKLASGIYLLRFEWAGQPQVLRFVRE